MKVTKAEKLELNKIAASYGYSPEDVTAMISSQYEFIKKTLKDLNLPNNLSEEEFIKVAKNFNIPAIGKLYSSYTVYKKLNKL